MASLGSPNRSIALHLAFNISQDSPTCSHDRPRRPTWNQHGHLGQIFSDLASIRDPKSLKNLQKPRKTLCFFHGFLLFSLTAKKPPKSSKIDPTSIPNRAKIAILAACDGLLGAILALLGAILAHLGALWRHLGALGRHLTSSSGSWSPCCCQRCRNIAPT